MGRRKTARLEPGDDENEDDILLTMMAYPDMAPLIPPSKFQPARPPPAARLTPMARPGSPDIVLSAHARRGNMAPIASGNPGKRKRQQEDCQTSIPPALRVSSSTQAVNRPHRPSRPLSAVHPRPVHTTSNTLISIEPQTQQRQNKANMPVLSHRLSPTFDFQQTDSDNQSPITVGKLRQGEYPAVINGTTTVMSSALTFTLFSQRVRSVAAKPAPLPGGEFNVWYTRKAGGDVMIYDSINYASFIQRVEREEVQLENGRVCISYLSEAEWQKEPGDGDEVLPAIQPVPGIVTVPKTPDSGFQKYNKLELPTPCLTPYPRSQPQSLPTPPDGPLPEGFIPLTPAAAGPRSTPPHQPKEMAQQIESSAASENAGDGRAHAPIATAMISTPASRVGQSYRVTVNRKQTGSVRKGIGYLEFTAALCDIAGPEFQTDTLAQADPLCVLYRDSSDKLVQIKGPDDYATFLHALEKKTIHRTGGRISFTVSLFEDEIQESANEGPDEETTEVPTFQPQKQKCVAPIPAQKEKSTSAYQGPKTRMHYKPSRKAQENADLQLLQSQSESKRKLTTRKTVSAKDARAARGFGLDHEE